MDSLAQNKRKNLDGQFDLFSMGSYTTETTVELVLKDTPEFTPSSS